MEESLPSRFDVVCMGTGLPETLIAAASSRSGLSLLHLDSSKYYGGEWASFTLHTLDEWKAENEGRAEDGEGEKERYGKVSEGEIFRPIRRRSRISSIRDEWTEFSEEKAEGEERNWRQVVEDQARRFNIDLTPKVLLAKGPMVQILCDADASKYAEFKLVDRLLAVSRIEIFRVPCSRSDIFDTEELSMVDKRRLVKFIQNAMQFERDPDSVEAWKPFMEGPLCSLLESSGVRDRLGSLVHHSLSVLCRPSSSALSTRPALSALCRFLDSVGRFGPSPFLCPLYGAGDLPQCFARLAAVFGGIYYIGREIDGVVEKDGRVAAVVIGGQRVEVDNLVMNAAFLPEEWMAHVPFSSCRRIFRAVLITNGSIHRDDSKEHITLLNLAAGVEGVECTTRLYEVGFEGCVAPKGLFLVHITTLAGESAEGAVDNIIKRFYSQPSGPRVLRRLQFEQETDEGLEGEDERLLLSPSAPSNLVATPSPDSTIDYLSVLEQAQRAFLKLCPDRDFLPRKLASEEEKESEEDTEKDPEAECERVISDSPLPSPSSPPIQDPHRKDSTRGSFQ